MNLQSILANNKEGLLKKKNVIGVAIGKDETGGYIVVMVNKQDTKNVKKEDQIPQMIEGVRVKIIETGKIRTR